MSVKYVKLLFGRNSVLEEVFSEENFEITESSVKPVLFWFASPQSCYITSSLFPWQFFNHFPASTSISNKIELFLNIHKMELIQPEVYNFHPKSFVLPSQFSELKEFMTENKKEFILKPDKGSLGVGCIILKTFERAERYRKDAVCQEYISPFLLNGLKFDFRIYVLVTSVLPFRIYIHNENMTRFCTQKYHPPSKSNIGNSFCHLTNYSINKENPDFVENEGECDDKNSHKRAMTGVLSDMKELGVNVDSLQQQIDDIVRLTFLSVQDVYEENYKKSVKVLDGRSRFFEILGFDIIVDKDAKPWLLEVNSNPSMADSSAFDVALKRSVVKGALHIMKLRNSFKKKLEKREKILNNNPSAVLKPLFVPEKESKRAMETNWRQIMPK